MTASGPYDSASKAGKVSVRVEPMQLPTAGMGFDNPNTPFEEIGGYLLGSTYPHPFHNHFLREKLVTKEYQRIILENAYLRVEFAPDLGGRIWRLYDKVHGEEIVHHNDSIKPYPGGFGGAYSAGGIELNYPYAHSVTNTWPRKTQFTENADGSVTYVVSEWERNGRTLWAMAFTLMPGEARLRQRVTIYNRGKLPVSYMYWGNAGVPADIDTKWIYREAMGSEHGGDLIYFWPNFRGMDLSLYKEDLEVIGIYFLDPKYNFFGITNTRSLSGLAHYASKHDLPGKKIWTWGRNLSGENRSWHLSVEQQIYGEVQSGRLINQEQLDWLMPEEYLAWDEQWSPIYGLSDVSEVTEDCAFQLVPEDRKILCYPFVDFKDQLLQVTLDGSVVKTIPLAADVSDLKAIDISDIPADNIARLDVKVIKNNEPTGSISIVGRCERKLPKDIRNEPIFNEHSSMAQFVTAEFSHKLMYNKKAMHYYRRAIEADDFNYKAHIGLGRMQFSQADFDGAKQSFLKALDLYKWDADSYMMLSHINQLLDDLDEALENAFSARYYGERCRANLRVGEVYIAKGQYASARKFIEEAKETNKMSLRAYALAALCERKLGKLDDAAAELDRSPEVPLKDLMWYSEKWFLGKISQSELEDALFHDEWRFLELGLDYAGLGLYDEAEKFLNIGIEQRKDGWPMLNLYNPDRIWGFYRKRETPFLHILKGYIAAKAGRADDAAKCFKDGDYFEYYVNTNEPELIPALTKAAESGNAYANHYLGNFMYHSLRLEDSLRYWRAAGEKAPKNAQNLRNLALYARFIDGDSKKAASLLREALKLNSNDAFLRVELVEAERASGAGAQDILDIYLGAPQEQKDTFLFGGLLTAYMAANRWEEAADYLTNVDRKHIDEDGAWYNFCISYADYLIDNGKPKEALQWIEKSRPNPANLGYVTYTEEWLPFHKQFYLTGLAYKMLGDKAKAEEYFRKCIEQPTDFRFFKPIENGQNLLRFYVALAVKELGMDATARTIMGGVNTYREAQALVRLRLEKAEIARWAEADPDSVVVAKKHAGPEI